MRHAWKPRLVWLGAWSLVFAACGATGGGDGAATDAGPRDGARHDAGPPDAGDAADPDGGGPDAGPDSGAPRCEALERCDGLDNDCDGATDEDQPTLRCGLGVCERVEPSCAGGVPRTCEPLLGAAPERCNAVDDDCDGVTDEDLPCQRAGAFALSGGLVPARASTPAAPLVAGPYVMTLRAGERSPSPSPSGAPALGAGPFSLSLTPKPARSPR